MGHCPSRVLGGELMTEIQIATSDGISRDDWDVVHVLAVEIANAAMAEDSKAEAYARSRMLDHLALLADQYGDKPSILATRADYTDTPAEQIALLEKAYTLAVEFADYPNMTFTAHSLAVVMIETLGDVEAGRESLMRLKTCLAQYSEEYEAKDYERLSALLASLSDRTEA